MRARVCQDPPHAAAGVAVGAEAGGGDHVAAGVAVGVARAPVVAQRQPRPLRHRAAGGPRARPPVRHLFIIVSIVGFCNIILNKKRS